MRHTEAPRTPHRLVFSNMIMTLSSGSPRSCSSRSSWFQSRQLPDVPEYALGVGGWKLSEKRAQRGSQNDVLTISAFEPGAVSERKGSVKPTLLEIGSDSPLSC